MTFLNVYRVYKLIGVETRSPGKCPVGTEINHTHANKLFLEKVNNKKKIIGIYSVIYNFQI